MFCLRDPQPSQIGPFVTNILGHDLLWVRVMSVKVYIFGKEITVFYDFLKNATFRVKSEAITRFYG